MKLNLQWMIGNPVMRLGFVNTVLCISEENEGSLNVFECFHGYRLSYDKLRSWVDFVINSAELNKSRFKMTENFEQKCNFVFKSN